MNKEYNDPPPAYSNLAQYPTLPHQTTNNGFGPHSASMQPINAWQAPAAPPYISQTYPSTTVAVVAPYKNKKKCYKCCCCHVVQFVQCWSILNIICIVVEIVVLLVARHKFYEIMLQFANMPSQGNSNAFAYNDNYYIDCRDELAFNGTIMSSNCTDTFYHGANNNAFMWTIVSMQTTDAYFAIGIVLACLMLLIPCMTLYGISTTNHVYLLPDIVLGCITFGIACTLSFISIVPLFAFGGGAAVMPSLSTVGGLVLVLWILSAKIKTYKYLKEKKLQKIGGYGQQPSQP